MASRAATASAPLSLVGCELQASGDDAYRTVLASVVLYSMARALLVERVLY